MSLLLEFLFRNPRMGKNGKEIQYIIPEIYRNPRERNPMFYSILLLGGFRYSVYHADINHLGYCRIYPMANCPINVERFTILNGKTQYFWKTHYSSEPKSQILTEIPCSTPSYSSKSLVGGLEHLDYFSIQLGMSSSQLTNSYFSEG